MIELRRDPIVSQKEGALNLRGRGKEKIVEGKGRREKRSAGPQGGSLKEEL